MLKRCPIVLASGVALSTLLLGYSNGEMGAAKAQNTPAPGMPGSKAGAPGKGPGAPGAPGKGPGAGGKTDPFAQKGPGNKMSGQPGGRKGGSGRLGPISRAGAVSGAPGGPGKAPAPGAAGAAAKVATLPPIKSKRKFDPFRIDWTKLPPPPYIFDNIVGPVRVASVDVEIPPVGEVTVREVPNRRVSGIMSGDGVFAILESADGSTVIVKPGMATPDGYKVVSITTDSVTLERKDGNVTRTQVVPLTDQGFSGSAATGGGGLFGGGNQTGRPGFGNPGGGLPGSGGGPRRPGRGPASPGVPGRPGLPGGPNGKE